MGENRFKYWMIIIQAKLKIFVLNVSYSCQHTDKAVGWDCIVAHIQSLKGQNYVSYVCKSCD